MDKRVSYERLLTDHDRIDEALARLVAMTTGSISSDRGRAALCLFELSDLVTAHLNIEDAMIYPTIARILRRSREDIDRMVSDFEDLKADWANYVSYWTAEQICDDWSEFCGRTSEMLPRLRERVRAESELLYSAALEGAVIDLRNR